MNVEIGQLVNSNERFLFYAWCMHQRMSALYQLSSNGSRTDQVLASVQCYKCSLYDVATC